MSEIIVTGKFREAAHSICNLCYKVPKKIPILIHNRSTYDDHFIIKKLPKEFKGKFECLGENTERYIIFLVPIKKEIVTIDDDDEEDGDIKEEDENYCNSKEEEVVNVKKQEDNNSRKKKTITYKIQLMDSYRLMPNKLSDLADNLCDIYNKE